MKKGKNCVKLSKCFEIYYFNSMKKLFWNYYQNNPTRNIKNRRAIECSIFRIGMTKIVRKFQNCYIPLKNINLNFKQCLKLKIIWTTIWDDDLSAIAQYCVISSFLPCLPSFSIPFLYAFRNFWADFLEFFSCRLLDSFCP